MHTLDFTEFVPEEPPVLYHYTSMSNLLKILESEQLWATSSLYLNDVSETRYFWELLKIEAEDYVASNPKHEGALLVAVCTQRSTDFLEYPFTVSFSADDDSLPQWRSYCAQGNGVSIGFRTNALKNAKVPGSRTIEEWERFTRAKLGAVQYVDRRYKEKIFSLVQEAVNRLERDRDELDFQNPAVASSFNDVDALAGHLEDIAVLTKHPGFSGEKEYRLYISSAWIFEPLIKHRPTRTTLVPYLPLSIDMRSIDQHRKAINEELNPIYDTVKLNRHPSIDHIRIGPTPNPELTQASLRQMFTGKGWDVEIKTSEVPYRDL